MRWAFLALFPPAMATADPLGRPWSLDGGSAVAECAAILSLLEPEEPDPDLSADFAARSEALLGDVRAFHGDAFADAAYEWHRTAWATRADSLGGRADLAAKLRRCVDLTGGVAPPTDP